MSLQQDVLGLRGDRPVAGLFEITLHALETVRARIRNEGNIPHFIIREEVGRGRQIVSFLRRVWIDGEVKGIVVAIGGRGDGVLRVELHESIAQLVLGHVQERRAVYPEVVVAWHGGEHL